jgi:hypothetical protein
MEQKDYNKIVECLAIIQIGWKTEVEYEIFNKAWDTVSTYGQLLLDEKKVAINRDNTAALKNRLQGLLNS